jgi:hypothetical protein
VTTQDIIEEVYELTGEQSDLDPYDSAGNFDINSTGAQKILRRANTGLLRVANWKDKSSGVRYRYRASVETIYAEYELSSSQTTGALSTSVIALDSSDSGDTNALRGGLLEIGDEKFLIASSVGAQVTIAGDFATQPASGTEYTLYRRWLDIDPVGDRYMEVLKVVDLSNLSELDPATRGDSFERGWETPGDPAEWYRIGDRVYFDCPVDSSRWFALEVYAYPTELSSASQEPNIPESFHWGIVLWTVQWGFSHLHDTENKYSLRQDFDNFMRTTVGEWEVQNARREADTISLEMR